MKKKLERPETLRRKHKLILRREHLTSMSRNLLDDELQRVEGGGSCYTDVRISQCCPDA